MADLPDDPSPPPAEADPRFPSGPWTGFFLQSALPGKNWMELHLHFAAGKVRGEGRDRIGRFAIDGRYDVESGRCHWIKAYLGQHRLSYSGYNESRGIWGTWEYHPTWRGGFHIWPVGMADPTVQRLSEEADAPAPPPEPWADAPAESGAEPVAEPAARLKGGRAGRRASTRGR